MLEDFGSILQHLSIDESKGGVAAYKGSAERVLDRMNSTILHNHSADGDSMEIDTTSDLCIDEDRIIDDEDSEGAPNENKGIIDSDLASTESSIVNLVNENDNNEYDALTAQNNNKAVSSNKHIRDEHDEKHNFNDISISSTLANVLSPTRLGAQLAVVPWNRYRQDLEATEEEPHYEFDTSAASTSQTFDTFKQYKDRMELKRRYKDEQMPLRTALNQFESEKRANSCEEYFYNSNKDCYDSYNGPQYMSSWNPSFLLAKSAKAFPSVYNNIFEGNPLTSTPIQIHNHYYYNTLSDIFLKGNQQHTFGDHSTHKAEPLSPFFTQNIAQVDLPSPWNAKSLPHDRIPYVLSSYLQFVINVFATGYASYLVYSIVGTIKLDIKHKLSQQAANTLIEIESCRRSYEENNCSPDLIVPILEKPCTYWKKCMNQDPLGGGGHMSRISAQTLGIIINSLIEPLGMKFFFVVFIFIVLFFLCNFTFGFIRAKTYFGWHNTQAAPEKSNK